MGFLDFLFLGAIFNSLNKKDNKRSNSFSQNSNYNYGYTNGYDDGYEDGYSSHDCDCCDYHRDDYDSYDNPDYECDEY